MKTTLKIALLSLVAFNFCDAQTLYKSGIDSGGDNVKVGNTKLLYTIGEVNVQELTVNNTYASEGFISPQEKIDVIITEIMQNPDAVSDANGEYFEVYNPTKLPINLKGWTIKDDLADASPHVIASDVIVPADGFVVLARNSNVATNGNVVVNYQYTDTDLDNAADVLILEDGENTQKDITAYDGGMVWPNPVGASMEYIGSNIQDNNDGSLWAAAKRSEGIDAPDLGSPGVNGEDQIVNHLVFDNDAWNEVPTLNTGNKNSIVMEQESTSIASDVSVLTLKIREGADVTIDTGVTVTTPDVILNSTSTMYSSLILNGDVSGDVSYKRHVNENMSVGGNDLVTPPVTGQAFNDFAAVNPNIVTNGANTLYLFGPFDKTTGAYLTYATGETEPIVSGVGYRAATTDNQTLTFKGVANKGAIDIPISNSGPAFQQWNLIGNPYPSYLNVQEFLSNANNLSLLDASNVGIYGYDGDASDGWIIYNLNTTTPSTLITPGQGFFVATNTSGSVAFTPIMRRTGTSDDFIMGRNSDFENTHLKLQLNRGNSSYATDFYFNENSTLGLDSGYDAGLWGGSAGSFSIYSELVEDNAGLDMAIQSLPPDNLETMIVPIGIHSSAGQQITIRISESQFPSSTDIFLEDRLNGSFTLLSSTDFVMTPTTALTGTGRFYLRFSDETLSTTTPEFDGLRIFTTKTPRVLTVNGQLVESAKLSLFDIRGRLVLTRKLNQNQINNTIDISELQDGVYIVKISNTSQNKTQKVIIR